MNRYDWLCVLGIVLLAIGGFLALAGFYFAPTGMIDWWPLGYAGIELDFVGFGIDFLAAGLYGWGRKYAEHEWL